MLIYLSIGLVIWIWIVVGILRRGAQLRGATVSVIVFSRHVSEPLGHALLFVLAVLLWPLFVLEWLTKNVRIGGAK